MRDRMRQMLAALGVHQQLTCISTQREVGGVTQHTGYITTDLINNNINQQLLVQTSKKPLISEMKAIQGAFYTHSCTGREKQTAHPVPTRGFQQSNPETTKPSSPCG